MPLFGRPDIRKLEQDRDTKGLIKALEHRDESLRKEAMEALERMGGEAVEPLIRALTDPNDNTRVCAALALGDAAKQANDRRAIEPLRGALKDANRWVRLHSAGSLTKIDPSETQAIQLLKEAAQDYSLDSSDDYRGIAASYLKAIPSA